MHLTHIKQCPNSHHIPCKWLQDCKNLSLQCFQMTLLELCRDWGGGFPGKCPDHHSVVWKQQLSLSRRTVFSLPLKIFSLQFGNFSLNEIRLSKCLISQRSDFIFFDYKLDPPLHPSLKFWDTPVSLAGIAGNSVAPTKGSWNEWKPLSS